MANTSSAVTTALGYTPIVYPGTGRVFRQCQTFNDFASYWKYSGNFGARSSAPTTLGTDTVFSNFNYDTSSWKIVNCNDTNYNDAADNYYWYISRLFYIQAGTFQYSGTRDDDEAWYLVPYGGGTSINVGGDITDTDGAGAGTWSSRSVTVSTSGFYKFVGRGIDGGGGNWLAITSINSGQSLFWVPEDEDPMGTIRSISQNQRADFPTTTDQNGFEFLIVSGIYPSTYTSKFLVQAVVAGQSGDDSRTYIEYRINGGSWNFLGPTGQMGDHSWTHRSNDGAMSLAFMWYYQPYIASSSYIDFRVRPTSENGNQGGFHLNHGISSPTGYNEDSAQSSLVVTEII